MFVSSKPLEMSPVPVSEANAPPWVERRRAEDTGVPRLLDRLLARELRVLLVLLHLVLALGAVRVLLAHLALVERHRRAGAARLVVAVVRLVLFLGRRRVVLRRAVRARRRVLERREVEVRAAVLDAESAASSSQKPRCTASEPAKYASTRLSSAANSGIAWRRGCGTDETRNVVLPARTRIFAPGGIGRDRACGPARRARRATSTGRRRPSRLPCRGRS